MQVLIVLEGRPLPSTVVGASRGQVLVEVLGEVCIPLKGCWPCPETRQYAFIEGSRLNTLKKKRLTPPAKREKQSL